MDTHRCLSIPLLFLLFGLYMRYLWKPRTFPPLPEPIRDLSDHDARELVRKHSRLEREKQAAVHARAQRNDEAFAAETRALRRRRVS